MLQRKTKLEMHTVQSPYKGTKVARGRTLIGRIPYRRSTFVPTKPIENPKHLPLQGEYLYNLKPYKEIVLYFLLTLCRHNMKYSRHMIAYISSLVCATSQLRSSRWLVIGAPGN